MADRRPNTWAIFCRFPWHTSREVGQKWDDGDKQGANVAQGGLLCCTTALASRPRQGQQWNKGDFCHVPLARHTSMYPNTLNITSDWFCLSLACVPTMYPTGDMLLLPVTMTYLTHGCHLCLPSNQAHPCAWGRSWFSLL